MLLNKKRTAQLMRRYNLAALIASSPENVAYSTGFDLLGHWILKGTQVYTVLPYGNDPTIIAPTSEADLLSITESWVKDIRCYGDFYYDFGREGKENQGRSERAIKQLTRNRSHLEPLDLLIQIIKDKRLDSSHVGVDSTNLSVASWERLVRALPRARIVEASGIFREIRMIKTEEEIKRLQQSAEITENAIQECIETARGSRSTTEADLATIFAREVVEHGAIPSIIVIGFGKRSAYSSNIPSKNSMKKGDLVRFDVGCVYKKYWSDLARMAIRGTPTAKQERYFDAVVKGELDTISLISQGTSASALFRKAETTVKHDGISTYVRHHCGHGIGIECYEPPRISNSDPTILQENMIVNIETPFYELGFGGVQIEDTIRVTKRGHQLLSTSKRELQEI